MSCDRTAITGIILLAVVPASGARRPSFDLDYSAWKATHMVLVTKGRALDGVLEVVESWKGDLAPRSRLTLPAFDQGSREIDWMGARDLPKSCPRSVTGSRMVVFLIRSGDAQEGDPAALASGEWKAADRYSTGTFDTAVAWIEQGETYAYVQIFNPGPSRLVHYGPLAGMKERIARIAAIQPKLEGAVQANDPNRASQVFRDCLNSKIPEAAKESIESIGKMGDRSLPTLRLLLGDPALSQWHPDIITALAKAGGPAVTADLMGVIDEELKFWSSESPRLKEGWWNAEPAGQRESRRNHYARLLQAWRVIVPPIHPSHHVIIVKTRDLWQTTAVLTAVGDDQVARACEALLKASPERRE